MTAWKTTRHAIQAKHESGSAQCDSDTSQTYRLILYSTADRNDDGSWDWITELIYVAAGEGRRRDVALATRKGKGSNESDAKRRCADEARKLVAVLGIQVTELVTNGADR